MLRAMAPDGPPTLADQVSRLYDLIAGYHVTHLLEIARELGVWEALVRSPGLASEGLATELGTDSFTPTCSAAPRSPSGCWSARAPDGAWRPTSTRSSATRSPASTWPAPPGSTWSWARTTATMSEVAEALKTLPRIFLDLVLPRLPGLAARLEEGGRLLDVGCGGGWAVVQIAERFPRTSCVGIDVEPYSVRLAQRLIEERGLADRCEAHARSVDQLGEDDAYDVVTSFLVVHEIAPSLKPGAFAAVARALKPGGYFLIFDEAYPETDATLQTMPTRFAALAQWYELTWGNVVDTRTALHERCRDAGLQVAEETSFSRFSITVAAKP
jgi:SAM-dependent methyltransferase